eukprot:CAMPEP_0172451882 /NCGR_PEP_ID=MMETSP1065-20121228/9721_1 /TAXON_ID=265537 /ORGANISM="Amphiprora paludosa, Strain CCMP125" /LENGTH=501 /DNA_ID=CAMNT_0013203853 /DNA_START=182 /DNA_END=1687 /DNA_ORIENTATION=-
MSDHEDDTIDNVKDSLLEPEAVDPQDHLVMEPHPHHHLHSPHPDEHLTHHDEEHHTHDEESQQEEENRTHQQEEQHRHHFHLGEHHRNHHHHHHHVENEEPSVNVPIMAPPSPIVHEQESPPRPAPPAPEPFHLDEDMSEESRRQTEIIATMKPTTELELALTATLVRKDAVIDRITAEIGKLKSFVQKRKQTYKRKRKDDGAPIRAMSAYNLFIKERFQQLAKENEKALKSQDANAEMKRVPPSNLVSKTGNEWKELPAEIKAKYEERAKADKKRYDDEMAAYNPPDKNANRKRNKTGYNMFFSAHVLRMKQAADTGAPTERGSVARMVGEAWKALTVDEKSYYEREADKHNGMMMLNQEKMAEKGGEAVDEDEDEEDGKVGHHHHHHMEHHPYHHHAYPGHHPGEMPPHMVHPMHDPRAAAAAHHQYYAAAAHHHHHQQQQHAAHHHAGYAPPPPQNPYHHGGHYDYSQHHQRGGNGGGSSRQNSQQQQQQQQVYPYAY